MKFTLPPIYPITDKALARREDHLSILRELVRGGAALVQIRDKDTPPKELMADLRRCVEFAAATGTVLIINDRCDLALSCGAAGVHLGQDDLPPESAREILGPDRILGLSTHSLTQVGDAMTCPVQYLGFGPIYATSTKEKAAPVAGIEALKEACRNSSKPVVAIGGIGLEQVREVIAAGAASVAVISALMTAKDLARRMAELLHRARARE